MATGRTTTPVKNIGPVGSPNNPSETPKLNKPTNPSTPISTKPSSGGSGSSNQEKTAGDLIREAREQEQSIEQLRESAQQEVNRQKEAERQQTLNNLEEARKQGQISEKSYQELRSNIQNAEQIQQAVEQAREERARQQQAQEIAQRAAQQNTAAEIIREARKLPEEYQSPENLRNIAQASADRQEGEKGLKEQEGNQGGDGNLPRDNVQGNNGSSSNLANSKKLETLPGETQTEARIRREGVKSSLADTKISEGYERIAKLASALTFGRGLKKEERGLIGKTSQTLVEGAMSTVPFFIIEIPRTAQKAGIAAGAAINPSTRESVGVEIKRSGKETKEGLIEFAKEPSNIIAVLAAPLIPIAARRFSKTGKAEAALKELETAKQEGKFPDVTFQQGPSIKTVKKDVPTTEVTKTPTFETTKPSKLITSQYETDIVRPGVLVGRGKKEGITQSVVQVGDTQYTTTALDGQGSSKIFVQSVTKEGKTKTKVFRDDTLLKEFEGEAKPEVVFTELLNQVKRKEGISAQDFRADVKGEIGTQKAVSAIEPKKYQPVGQAVQLDRTTISTVTKRPKTVSVSQPVVDLDKGTFGLEVKSLEVVPQKYKYVKFRPEEKPKITEKTNDGLIISEIPALAKTTQRSFTKRQGVIGYRKPSAKPVKPEETVLGQDFNKFEANIKKQIEVLSNGEQKPILKTENVQEVLVQKPRVQNTFKKSKTTIYQSTPTLKTKTSAPLLITAQGMKESQVVNQNLTKQERPTQKTIPLTKTLVNPLTKNKSIMDIFQEQKNVQVQVQKPVQRQSFSSKVIQEMKQSQVQQQVQNTFQLQQQLSLQKQLSRTASKPFTSTQSSMIPIPKILALSNSPELNISPKKQGFIAELKRRGKYFRVSDAVSRESALDIGTDKAKKTLGATFRVRAVDEAINENIKPTGEFRASRNMFKDTSGKNKSPLPKDTFIQKAKFRLSSSEERNEIKSAKMRFALA